MGLKEVVVVEMGQVGSGASSKTASMFTLHLSDDLSIRMAKVSQARYAEFEEEVGESIHFKSNGYLAISTHDTSSHLEAQTQLQQSLGVKTELLSPKDIASLCPELNIEDVSLGAWGPDDGTFEPHAVIWGYMRRAREMGVVLHQGVRATDIIVSGDRVAGVKTTEGSIRTRLVINAAGPWAVEVGKWADIAIPIINSKRSIAVTGPFALSNPRTPCIEDMTTEWYFRPEGPGVLMGMGASPTTDLDSRFTFDILHSILEAAVHRVPRLASASILTGWTGIRPMTLDNHPILGPVPGIEGLVLNCGWGGEGVMLAPVAGQIIAEYICAVQPHFDMDSFRIERFESSQLDTVEDMRIFARKGIGYQE
jgi:sarcosine oxidase subunit beta